LISRVVGNGEKSRNNSAMNCRLSAMNHRKIDADERFPSRYARARNAMRSISRERVMHVLAVSIEPAIPIGKGSTDERNVGFAQIFAFVKCILNVAILDARYKREWRRRRRNFDEVS
jgi:hypothetical protein